MKKMTTYALSLLGVFLLASCGGDDPVAGMAPAITSVTWTHPNCTAGNPSDVNIAVVATDGDNTQAELAYTGSVSGCNPGGITSTSATINCPQAAPYNGSVTVTDPDGNSDTQMFSISPCADGMAP